MSLRDATDYRDAILRVVNQGGDADTNAAVAGALLGARFGFDAIPEEWVESLMNRRVVETGIKLLVGATTSKQRK